MLCYRCGISPIAHYGLCYGCSVALHGSEKAAKLQKEQEEKESKR